MPTLAINYILLFAVISGNERFDNRGYGTVDNKAFTVMKLKNDNITKNFSDLTFTPEGYLVVPGKHYDILTKGFPSLLDSQTEITTPLKELLQTAIKNLKSTIPNIFTAEGQKDYLEILTIQEWIRQWFDYCSILEDDVSLCVEVDLKSIKLVD